MGGGGGEIRLREICTSTEKWGLKQQQEQQKRKRHLRHSALPFTAIIPTRSSQINSLEMIFKAEHIHEEKEKFVLTSIKRRIRKFHVLQ